LNYGTWSLLGGWQVKRVTNKVVGPTNLFYNSTNSNWHIVFYNGTNGSLDLEAGSYSNGFSISTLIGGGGRFSNALRKSDGSYTLSYARDGANTMYLMNTNEGSNWTTVNSSAAFGKRAGAAGAVFNSAMWMLGGTSDASYATSDVYSSTDGNTWSAASGTPFSARTLQGAGVLTGTQFTNGSRMFVFGGSDGTIPLNDVWASDDGANWTQVTSAAPWGARWSFGYTVFNNELWVMGGSGASTTYNDVWHSADGVNWTQATASASWAVRRDFEVLSKDGKMFLIGGNNAPTGNLGDVWSSTDGATWTQLVTGGVFGTRHSHQTTVFDDKLWIYGGQENTAFDAWYSYDGKNWTRTNNSPGYMYDATMLTYNNAMWILGGSSGNTRLESSLKSVLWT